MHSLTYELQLARHTTRGIFSNGYMPDPQYGFRDKLSSSDLAMFNVNQRQPCHLLQTDIASVFDLVDREQLTLLLQEAGVKLLVAYLTNRTFQVQLSGCQYKVYPQDVGVVQGSGLCPAMWSTFSAPTVAESALKTTSINLETAVHSELETTVAGTLASCAAARITLEPSK